MNASFLSRLYYACSCEERYFAKGFDLSELYRHQAEPNNTTDEFTRLLDEAHLRLSLQERLYQACMESVFAHEELGFKNGFRLGMQLAAEVGILNDNNGGLYGNSISHV